MLLRSLKVLAGGFLFFGLGMDIGRGSFDLKVLGLVVFGNADPTVGLTGVTDPGVRFAL